MLTWNKGVVHNLNAQILIFFAYPLTFFIQICYDTRMKVTIFKSMLIAALFSAFFVACSSVPAEIPEDLTAQELIQKGQDSFERRNYKAALRYYNAVTERYADSPAVYAEASYEIGHLFMKQKKYAQAEEVLQGLLDLYVAAAPGTMPGAYQKLAQLEIDKINEKKK